ncbi:MAG: putative membrane protein [Verrucomicrobiales bacterium]|jgi:uncharacterized membrane protein
MAFTFTFLKTFFIMGYLISPIIGFLFVFIIGLGLFVGRLEKWSRVDSFYYSLITASTVGYGDLRPTQKSTKLASVVIAMLGILLTGIVVATALKSLEVCFENRSDFEEIRTKFKSLGDG